MRNLFIYFALFGVLYLIYSIFQPTDPPDPDLPDEPSHPDEEEEYCFDEPSHPDEEEEYCFAPGETVGRRPDRSKGQICCFQDGRPNAGPQAGRHLDLTKCVSGNNPFEVERAATWNRMKQCDIHFHPEPEHDLPKPFPSYPIVDHVYRAGHGCLNKDSTEQGLKLGQIIEFHFAFTNATGDVRQPKLSSCVGSDFPNVSIRVEAQHFVLVNESVVNRTFFENFTGTVPLSDSDGWTAAQLPGDLNNLTDDNLEVVEYAGSTTGNTFDETLCSQYKVTWRVSKNVIPLDIDSVHKWCDNNDFNETHGHGSRIPFVSNPALLSPYSDCQPQVKPKDDLRL